MIGDIPLYLVDNNALFRFPPAMRTSNEFRRVVRLPSEVIHEAGQYATRYDLSPLEYRPTPTVLRHLKVVMNQVPTDGFELIDLYAGEGAADPLLVACALDAAKQRSQLLVGEVYTVVSDDIAVREACERHQVRWMSAADFAEELSQKHSD
ncbi:hypothetical protein [Nocardioides kribbensis]|uniref:hypothetical protein n=1 Tax=Nocardioides kribbensis TaxID=305517 RepID=UPI0018799425|nr:hypothetical protein [Nocardioides kribbensis]